VEGEEGPWTGLYTPDDVEGVPNEGGGVAVAGGGEVSDDLELSPGPSFQLGRGDEGKETGGQREKASRRDQAVGRKRKKEREREGSYI
jgi:hypothetical protein